MGRDCKHNVKAIVNVAEADCAGRLDRQPCAPDAILAYALTVI